MSGRIFLLTLIHKVPFLSMLPTTKKQALSGPHELEWASWAGLHLRNLQCTCRRNFSLFLMIPSDTDAPEFISWFPPFSYYTITWLTDGSSKLVSSFFLLYHYLINGWVLRARAFYFYFVYFKVWLIHHGCLVEKALISIFSSMNKHGLFGGGLEVWDYIRLKK